MAVNIKLKRSAVPGRVPDISSLELGEIALNTYDGKAYFKQQVGTTQSIVTLATSDSGSVTSASYATYAATAGSATAAQTATSASYALTASYTPGSGVSVSSSYAATASSADNFLVRNTLTAQTLVVQTITSSIVYSSGSNIFGNNSSNVQQFTGSVYVTGSLNVNGGQVYPFQITTGSIVAKVDTNSNNLFLIKDGGNTYLNIASNNDTTLYSDLFIVKNKTTQQPVLTVSQSVVIFASQSSAPTGTAAVGSMWFTSNALYVGLE